MEVSNLDFTILREQRFSRGRCFIYCKVLIFSPILVFRERTLLLSKTEISYTIPVAASDYLNN